MKMYEYFEDTKNVYLVTEISYGGELFDKILEKDHFCEKEAAKIFHQILSAISYSHEKGIVHRDLKPENFLIDSKDDEEILIKTIDFGLSKVVRPKNVGILDKMTTKVGTPYYVSPEVLTGSYDMSCDLWSAGCILYIMLCGYPPFNGDND